MKKAFLSIFLMLAFMAYALYVRILGTSTPLIASAIGANNPNPTLPLPQFSQKTNNKFNNNPVSPLPVAKSTGKYTDGSYTGSVADAYYGNLQVMAVISGGQIADVQFLDFPQDRQNSVRINTYAMPYLTSEAIFLQDSNVDTVSGASFTSAAFRESLASALLQARV